LPDYDGYLKNRKRAIRAGDGAGGWSWRRSARARGVGRYCRDCGQLVLADPRFRSQTRWTTRRTVMPGPLDVNAV